MRRPHRARPRAVSPHCPRPAEARDRCRCRTRLALRLRARKSRIAPRPVAAPGTGTGAFSSARLEISLHHFVELDLLDPRDAECPPDSAEGGDSCGQDEGAAVTRAV